MIVGNGAAGFESEQRGLGRLYRLQHAILAHPRVYDFAQAYGGGREIAQFVSKELRSVGGKTLLDIGAGTGTLRRLVPPDARYVWLDNDTLKLNGLVSNDVECLAVLGDASRLPLRDESVDVAVTVDVSHHLSDEALAECLADAARVCRERLVFVDAVRSPRLRSRLLWKLDLGANPRSEEQLVDAIGISFRVEKVERFRVHHDHLLCVGVPRRT